MPHKVDLMSGYECFGEVILGITYKTAGGSDQLSFKHQCQTRGSTVLRNLTVYSAGAGTGAGCACAATAGSAGVVAGCSGAA